MRLIYWFALFVLWGVAFVAQPVLSTSREGDVVLGTSGDDAREVVVKDLSKFRGMNPEELDFLTSAMKHHTFEEEEEGDGDPEAALLLKKVQFGRRASFLTAQGSFTLSSGAGNLHGTSRL